MASRPAVSVPYEWPGSGRYLRPKGLHRSYPSDPVRFRPFPSAEGRVSEARKRSEKPPSERAGRRPWGASERLTSGVGHEEGRRVTGRGVSRRREARRSEPVERAYGEIARRQNDDGTAETVGSLSLRSFPHSVRSFPVLFALLTGHSRTERNVTQWSGEK